MGSWGGVLRSVGAWGGAFRSMGVWGAILAVGLTGCILEPVPLFDRDEDGYRVEDDCDDLDPNIGARYVDIDGDGYGTGDPLGACQDPAGAALSGDCDDADPAVYPGAPERCNASDDDCDGAEDEELTPPAYFRDADGDGFGDPADEERACSAPTGYVEDDSDCDDRDAAVYPGAQEGCNLEDDDCDGLTDEGLTTSYFADDDGDGFGAAGSGIKLACAQPLGFADNDDDCNDLSNIVYPGAAESCNGTDDDCDGQIDEGALVTALAGGYFHSMALCSDGSVWAWGSNGYGQLGDGTTESRSIPVRVTGISGATAIAAGGFYSLALCWDEESGSAMVWAWGANDWGQLGDGTVTGSLTPTEVKGLVNVVAISAGESFSLAIKAVGGGSSGSVWAWGRNDRGQLGDGSVTQHLTPIQVVGISEVSEITAGGGHSVAVRSGGGLSSGEVWAWGANDRGQLGVGNTIDQHIPVRVIGLNDVIAIAAGGAHTLALQSLDGEMGGTVWAWGDNGYGQLGDGSSINHANPVQVLNVSDVVLIAAGYNHSLGLSDDGISSSLFAWGGNNEGELGDGTTTSRELPTAVQDPEGVLSIAAGANHSLATTWGESAGSVAWAWGANDYGQLGDGTTSDRTTPVQVAGL